ncbi:MAG TPA: GDP-L-fucose synthase [Acidobacteriaceae bacterium]|nr:GDP-L-fucose synthase [Acidobacteriaceae bacterium]
MKTTNTRGEPVLDTAMDPDSRVFIAGHRGLVGSAVRRYLAEAGYKNLLVRTRWELDLTDRDAVWKFFAEQRPDHVILAAAKVGGIHANSSYPVDFISENLLIQSNVIDACHQSGVKRLLFLGSSCIYPKLCPQPIREEYLLTGPLEPTNRPYAVAKIAGIEQCWAYNRQYGTKFLAVMPTNLYGPEDNFDLKNSHVLPALLHKVALAKARNDRQVVVWGTGTPRREFLYSDDLAEACAFLLRLADNQFDKLLPADQPSLVNVGVGEDITIRDLAELICRLLGYSGELVFDATQPDGTPRKLLDVSRMHALGWKHRTSLEDGIERTYAVVKDRLISAGE